MIDFVIPRRSLVIYSYCWNNSITLLEYCIIKFIFSISQTIFPNLSYSILNAAQVLHIHIRIFEMLIFLYCSYLSIKTLSNSTLAHMPPHNHNTLMYHYDDDVMLFLKYNNITLQRYSIHCLEHFCMCWIESSLTCPRNIHRVHNPLYKNHCSKVI